MPGRWSALAAGFELIINCQHEVSTYPGRFQFSIEGSSGKIVRDSLPLNWRELWSPLHEPPFPPRHPARPRPRLGGLSSRTRTSTRRTRFMVPMHGRKAEGAFHEPTHPRPLPGGEPALLHVLAVPLLGG